MAEHKKYWIKLEKDFLNSSQIKVIKNLPNGKDLKKYNEEYAVKMIKELL